MNISNKLEVFFKNRTPYYKEFLDKLDSGNIDYVLINLYNYGADLDKVSGDLDIIINPQDYSYLKNILQEQDFLKYIISNTNQIQWIKYVESIGTIQIHIHLDLSYYNTIIIKFNQLEHLNHTLDINEEYILFCLQTFYKNKYSSKIYKKYVYFQNKIDKSQVESLLISKYFKNKNAFLCGIENINNNAHPNKFIFYKKLMKNNFLSTLIYTVKQIYFKIKKIININSNDLEMVFMGVDGAGKSTTIENIKTILHNEIMYKDHYFGLKTSITNRTREYLSPEEKNNEEKIKNNDKNNIEKKEQMSIIKKVYFLIIGTLYWAEYNIKYFLSIKCNSIVPSTIHLIDRSYYDALLYYNIKFLDILFFKFSFKPDIIVYLTGDTNKLYDRKLEISKSEINFNKKKYNSLMKKFELNNFTILILDSTSNCEATITNIISYNIFQGIKRKVTNESDY